MVLLKHLSHVTLEKIMPVASDEYSTPLPVSAESGGGACVLKQRVLQLFVLNINKIDLFVLLLVVVVVSRRYLTSSKNVNEVEKAFEANFGALT